MGRVEIWIKVIYYPQVEFSKLLGGKAELLTLSDVVSNVYRGNI